MTRGYDRLAEMAGAEAALEETAAYLRDRMKIFLRPQERVLVCFPHKEPDSLGSLLERAVRMAGATPLFWGPDHRWKMLLRQAFSSRATVVMGPPLVLLGLTKLARATQTPLYIRNVVLGGYPCGVWALEGIQSGLDCQIWGCYGPGIGPVVGGFSCGKSHGIHVRSERYRAETWDIQGVPTQEGEMGEVVLFSRTEPPVAYPTGERGRLLTGRCPCGSTEPRIVDFSPNLQTDTVLLGLFEMLLSWSSILDCRVTRSRMGLEMEVVNFPGQRIPQLPSCARLVVRPWVPDRDMPFFLTDPNYFTG